MTAVDDCRGAVESAEAAHADATRRASDAAASLEQSELALGDDPSPVNVKSWRAAREELDISRLVLAAATRRLDTARADLDSAELDAAREAIARLAAMTERAEIFRRLARPIMLLATPVPSDASDDDFAADAIARRDASRQIDATLTGHVAAVEAVTSAHARLAQAAPRLVPVTRSQVDAAVEIERISISEPDRNAAATRCQYAIKPRTPLLHLGPGDVTTICERARTELVSGDCYR